MANQMSPPRRSAVRSHGRLRFCGRRPRDDNGPLRRPAGSDNQPVAVLLECNGSEAIFHACLGGWWGRRRRVRASYLVQVFKQYHLGSHHCIGRYMLINSYPRRWSRKRWDFFICFFASNSPPGTCILREGSYFRVPQDGIPCSVGSTTRHSASISPVPHRSGSH